MNKSVLVLSAGPRKGIIYGAGAWNVGDIIGRPAMKRAYAMGKNI